MPNPHKEAVMAVADEKTEGAPAAVPHFTVAERAARGRAARLDD